MINHLKIIYSLLNAKTKRFTVWLKKNVYTATRLKQYFFAVFSLYLFIFYQSEIVEFVEHHFIVNHDSFNIYFDIILIFSSLVLTIFILKKVIKDKYLPSYNEIFIAIFFYFIICYYDLKQIWNYEMLHIKFIRIEYVTIILMPFLIFLLSTLYNYLNPKINKVKKLVTSNEFLSDDPIFKIDDDKLDSKKVANNLIRILKNEKHTNSFTLGLVGPWGNGKSSVINLVKNYFKENIEPNTIVIHFLPYLNHNENDIINEFFILLSNELGKYSGKVSNQLMIYSKKLTNLYKGKNIFNFLEDHITKIDSTSANKLYTEINEILKEIDKKIIVLVDDLDRLNEKEILQVLKLIRNTANFNNTFFIVAMDKEYVLSRLKSNNDILNSSFIDKFFQLEIYLPEIDNSILRNYFFDCLKKSVLKKSDSDFENQLIEALSNRDNLFDDYIKNFRDVKRVTNQIIYDYPIFKKDINFKDFMNFTYFKLKFPKHLKLLNDKRADFIYIDRSDSTYNLIKNDNETADDFLNELNKVKMHNIDFLNKYKIYSSEKSEQCHDSELSINSEDKALLMKTLAYLFGEENNVPLTNSIKNENNFRMLMQQRIFSNYFTQAQFEQLYEEELDTFLLVSFNAQEKLPQLLNRLKYYNTQNEELIKRTLEILVELYDKRDKLKLYDQEILLLLEEFVQRQFNLDSDRKIVYSKFQDWLKIKIFDNEKLSVETRLQLYGFVTTTRTQNANWNISSDYINEKVIKLLELYMDSFRNNLWKVNEYPVYRIYHSIKIIGNLKNKINQIFIAFWKDHIEFFCAQTTDLVAFSNNRFNIADTVIEFFGSKQDFVEFVRVNKDASKGVLEFLHFFDLLEKVNYDGGILFEFQDSEMMKEKIEDVIKSPGRSNYNEDEKVREVFFEINNEELATFIVRNFELRKKYPISRKVYLNIHYLIVSVDRKEEKTAIANFMNEALNSFDLVKLPTAKPSNIKTGFEVKIRDNYIKIYSIEPKFKNI